MQALHPPAAAAAAPPTSADLCRPHPAERGSAAAACIHRHPTRAVRFPARTCKRCTRPPQVGPPQPLLRRHQHQHQH
ncbi:hypothetical protein DENSPDRAFT_838347 [Dentipellis sp. KUC8613]|nr:hypothetical protein DENSPDRAFT_838347 [Dentipellis sp. KUC8613]